MNYCPECGAELLADSKFCHNCGFDIRTIAADGEDIARDPSPGGEQRETEGVSVEPPAHSLPDQPPRGFESGSNVPGAFIGAVFSTLLGAVAGLGFLANGNQMLFIAYLGCLGASVVCMATDLWTYDENLGGYSTWSWVIGSILLWIAFMPWYLFSRYKSFS